jgi:hypothetical protein
MLFDVKCWRQGEALEINLYWLFISIVVNTIILSPVLWLSGRALVGKDKAKFTDAIWIVILGTVIGTFLGAFLADISFSALLAVIIQLIVWLALVKHFFDCGWLKALAISILAVIVFVIVVMILAVIGVAIWALGF